MAGPLPWRAGRRAYAAAAANGSGAVAVEGLPMKRQTGLFTNAIASTVTAIANPFRAEPSHRCGFGCDCERKAAINSRRGSAWIQRRPEGWLRRRH